MHSQIGIMNLSINPTNPTPTTQIKAVAYSFFSSSGCIFKNSTVTVSNDTIRVLANHQVGPFMALCYITDTISIGQFAPGFYTLIFTTKEYQTSFSYDTDTINFNVSLSTGINLISKTDDFKISPNPFTNELTVNTTTNELKKLVITNTLGQPIYTTEFYQSNYTINLPQIPSGAYIATLYLNNQINYRVKLIKQ
jgi:hypothetical protein